MPFGHIRTFLLYLGLLALGAFEAGAQSDAPAPYNMPRSEVLEAQSLGRTYELYVKLPPSYHAERNKDRRYRVIYVNDSHYTFQTVSGVSHMPMNTGAFEHVIIVGVSFAKGERVVPSRSRDFTPFALGPDARFEHGGAKDYLQFFKQDIIPMIDATYRTNPSARTLVGHSYGGLFGVYALLTEPDMFSAYILTSPSLWLADKRIFELEKEMFDDGVQISGQVYFATGETETPAIQGGRHDLVADQHAFVRRLRARGYDNLEIRSEIIEGGTHPTTFPIGLTRALMWLHEGPKPRGW